MQIRTAVTLFSGFCQRPGSPGSGFSELERRLCAIAECRDARVQLHTWNANVAGIAEHLWRWRADDEPQRHVVIGYSYGCQAACNFLRELAFRGDVRVAAVLLCDPVRRWRWLPGAAAALGVGSLWLPALVPRKAVTVYRQKNPRLGLGRPGGIFQPAGHVVRYADGQAVPAVAECEVGHVYMDNLRPFTRACEQAVRELVGAEHPYACFGP